MTKVKRYLSKQSLISMYYSLIYPYLTYGSIHWGNNLNLMLENYKIKQKE